MIKKVNQLQTRDTQGYKKHFSNHFCDKKITTITLTMNDHQLEHEITLDEVTKSIMKLNNNRVPGYDRITTEMIKYGLE